MDQVWPACLLWKALPVIASSCRKLAVDSGFLLTAGTVLLAASAQELAALAKEAGQSTYRGKQLSDSIRNGARSLQDIHNARHVSITHSFSSVGLMLTLHVYCWQLHGLV